MSVGAKTDSALSQENQLSVGAESVFIREEKKKGTRESNVSGKHLRHVCLATAIFWAGILYASAGLCMAIEMPQPVACYTFEDDTFNDSVGSYHGTGVGGADVVVHPGRGKVLALDGNNDAVALPSIGSFDAFTITMWVYPTEDLSPLVFTGGYNTDIWSPNGVHFKMHYGRVNIGIYGVTTITGGNVEGTTVVPENQWSHIAVTYQSGTEVAVYFNGVKEGSRTSLNGTGNLFNAHIGAWYNQGSLVREMPGYKDDVRIYNQALSDEQIACLAHPVLHVDPVRGNDDYPGTSRELALATIPKGIQACKDKYTLLLWPGVYQAGMSEVLNFQGKVLTVKSAADVAILESTNNWAVVFQSGEQANCVLENVVICNSYGGIHCIGSSPTLRHVTVAWNQQGLEAWAGSQPVIRNSIFWGNVNYDLFNDSYPHDVKYSCIERSIAGEGNISEEPLFADPNHPNPNQRDYHLRSERGRFMPDSPGAEEGFWVLDDQTSPCVDVGDPLVNPMTERMPNGGQINMGAYGNTYFASMNEWPLEGDINHDGVVNLLDYALTTQNWLKAMPWYQ